MLLQLKVSDHVLLCFNPSVAYPQIGIDNLPFFQFFPFSFHLLFALFVNFPGFFFPSLLFQFQILTYRTPSCYFFFFLLETKILNPPKSFFHSYANLYRDSLPSFPPQASPLFHHNPSLTYLHFNIPLIVIFKHIKRTFIFPPPLQCLSTPPNFPWLDKYSRYNDLIS